jgi:hypothetical protein
MIRRLLYHIKRWFGEDPCEYGYHKHLTLAYGDGFFDVWTCDECGQEALCTGDLINHGADEAAKRLLKVAQDSGHPGSFGGEHMNQCAQEIKRLHARIKELEQGKSIVEV